MASKSLGSLTLDLVAKTAGFVQGMDKAERSSAKWKKQTKKDLKEIGDAFKIASLAAAAGLTLITAQTVKTAEEVQRFASLAGTSNREFQKYAVGAKAIGIEQEKLADIFKDTSDKVGDFLQTGAGPLADFFENIAPQVGVTADQFRNLSGPQALGLYVDSLQKANLSQNELTFFLEAIASDSALLLPLLKDNAAGFKLFGDEAERAGSILNDETIKAANDLNAALFISKQATVGFKNDLVSGLIPVLSDLSVLYLEVSETGDLAKDSGEFLGESLRFVASAAAGAVGAFELAGKAIGGFFAIFSALGRQEGEGFFSTEPLKRAAEAAKIFKEDFNSTASSYADLIDQIKGVGSETDAGERVKKLSEFLAEARDTTAQTAEITKKSGQEFKSVAEQLKEYEDALKSAANAQEKINKEAISIADSLLSEEESIKQSYERRKQIILDNTAIQGEAQTALLEKLEEERNSRLQALVDARNSTILASTGDLFSNLSALAKQFAGEESSTYKALFAVEKAIAIARSIVAIQTGIAQASAQPFPANLAAIASVASATANIVSTIQGTQIEGMAHDGMDEVPKTGTYLLEKGERVTTEKTSAKLDRTLDQVKQGGGKSGMMQPNIVVNNYSGQPVQALTRDDVVEIMVGEMGNQRSRARKSLQATSNVQSRGV